MTWQQDQDSRRDADAKRAHAKLQSRCLIVLNAVRLHRRTAGHKSSDCERQEELDRLSERHRQRLEDLVAIARKEYLGEKTAQQVRSSLSQLSSAALASLCEDDFAATAESLLSSYTELRDWFFESPVFQEWQKGRPWYLYCYGEPRCGKSTFAAAVSRWLQHKYADHQSVIVSLFLGHASNRERYSVSHAVLSATLKHLIESKQMLGYKPVTLDKLKPRSGVMSVELLQGCILEEMEGLSNVFLVVDGIDVTSSGGTAYLIENDLADLLKASAKTSCGLRLMLVQALATAEADDEAQCDVLEDDGTPCHERCDDIHWTCDTCLEGEFSMCLSCRSNGRHCEDESHVLYEPYRKRTVNIDSVLEAYIQGKLNDHAITTQIGRRMSHAKGIVPHITNDINRKAKGVFLIAKLYVDFLTEQQSIEEVLDVLDRLPSYQRLYFDSLIHEIVTQDNEDKSLALSAMALVAASRNGSIRPLAMSFEELMAGTVLLSQGSKFTEARFLKCTKGLLTIIRGSPEMVKTFHESANTYLQEECEEISANYRVDSVALCIQTMKTFLAAHANSVGNPKTIMQHLKDEPFSSYAFRAWAWHLYHAHSAEAMAAGWEFLDTEYRQQALIKQATFLATNNTGYDDLWTGGSPLHLVAWFGLKATLRHMQNEGITDQNAQDFISKRTPLHLACIRKNWRTVPILLKMGADMSVEDSEGRTALWESVDRCDRATLSALVKAYPSPQLRNALNARNTFFGGQTVLMLALQKSGHSEQDAILDILVKQPDLDLGVREDSGRTALHVAASMGYLNSFLQKLLHNKRDIDLSTQDIGGRTPAMAALSSGHFNDKAKVAKLLNLFKNSRSQTSLDINAVDFDGRSLFHYVVTAEVFEPLAQYLMSEGADINKRDAHKRTPLHLAAAYLDQEPDSAIVRLLVSSGADLEAADEQGMTPHDLAVRFCVPWAEQIMPPGDPTGSEQERCPVISWDSPFQDKEFATKIAGFPDEVMKRTGPIGFTLLHCAAAVQDASLVDLLLQDGRVDANAEALVYVTALHLATSAFSDSFNFEIIQLLVNHGVDVNAVNYLGKTALQCAIVSEEPDAALLLIKNGANLVIPRDTTQELLHHAILNDDLEAVEILLAGGSSLFLYCRPGLLPSETAEEDGASEAMIDRFQEIEKDVLEKVAEC